MPLKREGIIFKSIHILAREGETKILFVPRRCEGIPPGVFHVLEACAFNLDSPLKPGTLLLWGQQLCCRSNFALLFGL